MKREWKSSILCMPAVPWYAKIAGSVFRAAITARAARWLRRSPRRLPTGSKSRKRCATLRNTPGRRSPEASVPAWASSFPTTFSLRAARARLAGRILGASCYDRLELAQAAVAAGVDYVAFGSVFASPTKPGAVRAPHSLFTKARKLGVPLAAIGGITLENAPRLISAGADLLAVISDLFEAPDVSLRARQYGKLFT